MLVLSTIPSDTRLKKKREEKRNEQKKIYKKNIPQMHNGNTSAMWQQAAHTTYQLQSLSCSTKAIQKSLTLNKQWEFSGKKAKKKKKSQEMDY